MLRDGLRQTVDHLKQRRADLIDAGVIADYVIKFLAVGVLPTYLTFALLAPVTGLTALTFITSANTYMQLHTDAGVRGRVMALYLMIFMGGTPVGAPIIGWIGHEYGARWTLLGGGLMTIVGVVLSAMLYLRLERARNRRAVASEETAHDGVQDGVRTAPAAF